jgi:hypothetical protein
MADAMSARFRGYVEAAATGSLYGISSAKVTTVSFATTIAVRQFPGSI